MSEGNLDKVLCIDDDAQLLAGLRRQLGTLYEIHIAQSGKEALQLIKSEGPFKAVICDMNMPEIDGATFLTMIRERYPETVRLLLTGQCTMDLAIQAVNAGQVYKFLTKPCVPQMLREVLREAVLYYERSQQERALLRETFLGSVRALGQVLEIVQPASFAIAARTAELVGALGKKTGADSWDAELAATLCTMGYVTQPAFVAAKLLGAEALAGAELQMVERARDVTVRILGNIPRLAGAIRILTDMDKGYSSVHRPDDHRRGEELPWGARAIKVAKDFECFKDAMGSVEGSLRRLREQSTAYDPVLLRALQSILGSGDEWKSGIIWVSMDELEVGMLIMEGIFAASGNMLIPKGQQVTDVLLARLRNYQEGLGIREPIAVGTKMALASPRQ